MGRVFLLCNYYAHVLFNEIKICLVPGVKSSIEKRNVYDCPGTFLKLYSLKLGRTSGLHNFIFLIGKSAIQISTS